MIARALPVAMAGATVAALGLGLVILVQRAVLRLDPPEGFEKLPSPPRPLDFQLLLALPTFAVVAFAPIPISLLLASLGESAGYPEALKTWAKALSPLCLVFAILSASDARRDVRPSLSAYLRRERPEPSTQKSSSIRMTGVAFGAATLAGMWWASGFPNAERPPQIIIQPAGAERAVTDPAARPSARTQAAAPPGAGATASRPPRDGSRRR